MESFQAVRPVSKNILDSHASSSPPPGGPIVHVVIHKDPGTPKGIVLWEDIRLVFDDALHIRHHALAVPFLKGADYNPYVDSDNAMDMLHLSYKGSMENCFARIPHSLTEVYCLYFPLSRLKPLRIAALPDVVLDVVVTGPVAQQGAVASTQPSVLQQIRQQAAQLPRHNPFATLRTPYSIPTPANNFGRTFNNRPSFSTSSRTPSNGAATQLRNKELILKRAKKIMAEIAAKVDLEALHAKGDGPPKDFFKAMEDYLKTVHKGHTHAQINVGDMFLEGRGVQKDTSVAMGWYLKAAYYGDTNAQRKVEALRL